VGKQWENCIEKYVENCIEKYIENCIEKMDTVRNGYSEESGPERNSIDRKTQHSLMEDFK
jgi:hypothetical protein